MRHGRLSLLIAMCTLLSSNASAGRNWERITIPGARCGDGSPYSILIDRTGRDPSRLLFYFQGGGACWDWLTCHGPVPLAPLRIPRQAPASAGILSENRRVSPVTDYTVVYFPYCTGDVHAGTHTAYYGMGTRTHHWGARNIDSALAHLFGGGWVSPAAADRIVVYGFSSGALGAMFNVNSFIRYVRREQNKVAILDAPGLHFGKGFWRKFPRRMLEDYRVAMRGLGVALDPDDGNVAAHAPEVGRRFSDWKVGVLQGSLDLTMSVLFARIGPFAHERAVYGPSGIFEVTLDSMDNCSAWVPRTPLHTFLTSDRRTRMRAGGITAMEFVSEILDGYGGLNYK